MNATAFVLDPNHGPSPRIYPNCHKEMERSSEPALHSARHLLQNTIYLKEKLERIRESI